MSYKLERNMNIIDEDIKRANELGWVVFDPDDKNGVVTKKLIENIENCFKDNKDDSLSYLRLPVMCPYTVSSIQFVCDLDEEECLKYIDDYVIKTLKKKHVGIAIGKENNAIFFVW